MRVAELITRKLICEKLSLKNNEVLFLEKNSITGVLLRLLINFSIVF